MTLRILFILTILANMGDNLTTYLALTSPVHPGNIITEANPLARYLFEQIGLVPGLLFDMLVTVGVLYYLMNWNVAPYKLKVFIFGTILAIVTWAVVNNTLVLYSGAFV